ncbi:hypothetical protein ACWDKQ_33050 [Saccharopolyspora sp. NPDC000995]
MPTFALVAGFLALVNSTSSGILMTLGADLAPQPGPAQFSAPGGSPGTSGKRSGR